MLRARASSPLLFLAATVDLPKGSVANGTLKVDTKKATQYLQDQAGINMTKFLEYAEQLPVIKAGAEYTFQAGSGLEQSHITFKVDEPAFATHSDAPGVENFDCNKCWIACTAVSWFPPAFAM